MEDYKEGLSKFVGMFTSNYGLRLVFRGTEAKTDGKTIIVPELSLLSRPNMTDEDVQEAMDFLVSTRGFVYHEGAHIMFSEFSYVDKARKYGGPKFQFLVNVIEDMRIERKVGNVYPGAATTLAITNCWITDQIAEEWKEQLAEGKEAPNHFVQLQYAISLIGCCSRKGEGSALWKLLDPKVIAMADRFRIDINRGRMSMNTKGAYNAAKRIWDTLKQESDERKEKQKQAEEKKRQEEEEKKRREEGEDGSGGEGDETEEQDGEESDAKPSKSKSKKKSKKSKKSKPKKEKSTDAESSDDDDGGSDPDDGSGDSDDDSGGDDSADEDAGEGDAGDGADEEAEDGDSNGDGDGADGGEDDEDDDEASPRSGSGDAEDDEGDDLTEDDGSDLGLNDDGLGGDGDESGGDGEDEIDEEPGSSRHTGDDGAAGGGTDEPPEDPDDLDLDGTENNEEKKGKKDVIKIIARKAAEEIVDAGVKEYRVYSTQYDQIGPPPDPATPEERQEYRQYIKKLSDDTRSIYGPVKRTLENLLKAQTRSYHVRGLEEGDLDGSSLHQLAAASRSSDPRLQDQGRRVFMQKVKMRTLEETAVGLSIDISGSMGSWGVGSREPKDKLAQKCALIFSHALHGVNVPFEITAWTTVDGAGDKAMRQITSSGDPKEYELAIQLYTRFGGLKLLEIKRFEEKFPNVDWRLAHIRHDHCNYDGEGVLFAARRLQARPEKRKVLFVMCDGIPGPCEYESSYVHSNYLHQVVREIRTSTNVELIGIGIGAPGAEAYYRPAFVNVSDTSELPKVVVEQLKSVLLK